MNLFTVQGETAGLRVDDLILFALSFILFWAHFSVSQSLQSLEKWMFALVGFSFFSFVLNQIFVALGVTPFSAKIFYCFRPLEYFIFFYVGAMACDYFSSTPVVRTLFGWNLLLMLLQKVGLIGSMSSHGYIASVSSRITGMCSFPNELGILLNLLFCYFVFQEKNEIHFFQTIPKPFRQFWQTTRSAWLFLLFAVLITWTGSRIALAALVVCYLAKLKGELGQRGTLFFSGLLLPLFVGVIAIVMMNTGSIFFRSEGLLNITENVKLIPTIWDHIDPNNMQWETLEVDAMVDTSWWLRLHKWCHAVKLFVSHPEAYLTGIGPGFASAALDGGLLRIIVEYGLIGTVLFFGLFRSIAKISPQLSWMVIAILINMIFIDAYLAYKPMSLLFFLSGITQVQNSSITKFD